MEQPSQGRAVKRVGIVFSGGPAPAANAVISTCALRFIDSGLEAIGFFDGYAHLVAYDPARGPLVEGQHFLTLSIDMLTGLRNQPGVFIRTSRTNPGGSISHIRDLDDPAKTARLARVYQALVDLEIDALVSIGGDGTLRSANLLVEYQRRLPPGSREVKVVHLPKTIDNDYRGIDFTFGYFTAVDTLAREVRNLRADAHATASWFIAEVMGRQPGWLAYGVGIAGEANLMFAVEDLDAETSEVVQETDHATGQVTEKRRLRIGGLANRIVDLMIQRETRQGKRHGVVVLAEGLSDTLPDLYTQGIPRHDGGGFSLGHIDIGKIVAQAVSREYQRRTGQDRKVKGLQLGYEARCAPPNAFDVILACSLGSGAHRALVDHGLTGYMVTLTGQMTISFVPFSALVHPEKLHTEVRFIDRESDFYRLARALEDIRER